MQPWFKHDNTLWGVLICIKKKKEWPPLVPSQLDARLCIVVYKVGTGECTSTSAVDHCLLFFFLLAGHLRTLVHNVSLKDVMLLMISLHEWISRLPVWSGKTHTHTITVTSSSLQQQKPHWGYNRVTSVHVWPWTGICYDNTIKFMFSLFANDRTKCQFNNMCYL